MIYQQQLQMENSKQSHIHLHEFQAFWVFGLSTSVLTTVPTQAGIALFNKIWWSTLGQIY